MSRLALCLVLALCFVGSRAQCHFDGYNLRPFSSVDHYNVSAFTHGTDRNFQLSPCRALSGTPCDSFNTPYSACEIWEVQPGQEDSIILAVPGQNEYKHIESNQGLFLLMNGGARCPFNSTFNLSVKFFLQCNTNATDPLDANSAGFLQADLDGCRMTFYLEHVSFCALDPTTTTTNPATNSQRLSSLSSSKFPTTSTTTQSISFSSSTTRNVGPSSPVSSSSGHSGHRTYSTGQPSASTTSTTTGGTTTSATSAASSTSTTSPTSRDTSRTSRTRTSRSGETRPHTTDSGSDSNTGSISAGETSVSAGGSSGGGSGGGSGSSPRRYFRARD